MQETFLGMTDADPYFGYKLLSAQIQDSLEQKGIPVGVLLIHDVMTDSLHTRCLIHWGKAIPALAELRSQPYSSGNGSGD